MATPDLDEMAELFDGFTRVWDGIDAGAFSAWLAGQLDLDHGGGGRPQRGRAVDLGCGAGRHLPVLAERYGEVLGIDVSARILELARRHHGGRTVMLRRAGVLDLDPAVDGRFDAVVSVNALHHVGDPAVVLPQVRDLVAPGGRLVVVDMVDPGHWSEPGWHVDRAFADARAAYDLTADVGRSVAVLRQLLDPTWLAMGARDRPLTRDAFHETYGAAFPDASLTDTLHPLMAAATWTAPT